MDNLIYFFRNFVEPPEHRCVFVADAKNPPAQWGPLNQLTCKCGKVRTFAQ